MTEPLAHHQTWTNKGSNPMPDWLEPHVAGSREPNGSFLIRTRIGRETASARVHVGCVALVVDDIARTCEPDELSSLLLALERAAETPPPPKVIQQVRRDAQPKPKPAAAPKPFPVEKGRTYPEPIGDPPSIEWIKVDRLSVDAAYQRSTENQASQRLIASIAARFDWRLCAPLVVSRRPDGSLAVIDGQHRTMAALKRGDIPHLPCCVFRYEGPEEEARMFIAANRARKPMNRLDDFHAALAGGDSEAHEVAGLVADAGLSVARNTASAAWKPGEIAFTASIATVIKKHGREVAATALKHIADAFPEQRVVHSGSIFLGLVKLLTSPPEGFDSDRMFTALLRYSAEEWGSFVSGLKGGDTRAVAIRDVLLMAYDEVPGGTEGVLQ